MKTRLEFSKIEEKKNLINFKFNEEEYIYNTKTEFVYKKEKNKDIYVSNFDKKIKEIIKKQYISFKKYNKI